MLDPAVASAAEPAPGEHAPFVEVDLSHNQSYRAGSAPIAIEANSTCACSATVIGQKGAVGCGYLALFFLDSSGNEVGRRVRWINDFSGEPKEYVIRARPIKGSASVIAGFRVNTELPPHRQPAAVHLALESPNSVRVIQVAGLEEIYDEWHFDEAEWSSLSPSDGLLELAKEQRVVEIGLASGDRPPEDRIAVDGIPLGLAEQDIRYLANLMVQNKAELRDFIYYYTSYHMRRFLTTLSFLPTGTGRGSDRLLDIGNFKPQTFAIHRHAGYDEVRMTNIPQSDQAPMIVTLADPERDRLRLGQLPGRSAPVMVDVADMERNLILRFHEERFNAETEVFPYPDGYFETVLCAEVLEHLQQDPMFMFEQINRVLRLGGKLLLTTPNVVAAANVRMILSGSHPTGINTYGKYGIDPWRHHREYTPNEVKHIVEAAGFAVERLETLSTWGESDVDILKQIEALGYSTHQREANIFCLATKVQHGINERYPVQIYH